MANLPGAVKMSIGGVPARTLKDRRVRRNPAKMVALMVESDLLTLIDKHAEENFIGGRAGVVRKALLLMLRYTK